MLSKQLTVNQVRREFLDAVISIEREWLSFPNKTTRERVSGALFSMLVLLDGGHGSMPAFCVEPRPHPDDKEYFIDHNEDYYPPIKGKRVNDIAGSLHDLFCKLENERGSNK